ncbi:hypothetical protein FH972_020997 [Carpinus fangiana]|uniref:Mitochondrial intermembrane space import and assembly protein 40 n=1 Tax=Carpinus fangiana TaxID=176857 RepID=A0A5N6KNF3_9ROSI|nr:hypothetical protein FH972_020997 [Carpinus fangiana]
MLGQTSRIALRAAPRAHLLRSSVPRRTFILSPPAGKRGSWKGFAARWAVVIGGVYYYNTSNVFAEEPIKRDLQQRLSDLPIVHAEEETLPTIDDIATARKQRLAAAQGPPPLDNEAASMSTDSASLSAATSQAAIEAANDVLPGGPEDLEEEAGQQGAFNEETGEINWDCPCLGGMAHGPCGPQFREAFSCFVYSKEDPKGIDCIDRFKGMQDCFRLHPDIYGAELTDDEDPSLDAEIPDAPGSAPSSSSSSVSQDAASTPLAATSTERAAPPPVSSSNSTSSQRESRSTAQTTKNRSKEEETRIESAIPKEARDATSMNKGK